MRHSEKSRCQGTLGESLCVFTLVLGILMYGMLGLKLSAHLPLVAATLISSSIVIFFTGSPAVGYVITGSALGEKYDEQGVDRVVLARTISDAATAQQPLVPWGASGAFVANCFGVAVSQIAPWYFVGWLMPLLALLWALTGISCPCLETTRKQ